ncbi:MAG TPA: membrane dipeptidase [Gaiellaceae bacterium]|nr:membrane dipeptidase [Gaiellaceae bacterium]
MSEPWIADAHVDLLLELAGRSARGEENPFGAHWLPPLTAGGVRLQVCPIYVEGDLVPDGAMRSALRLAGSFHEVLRDNARDVFQIASAPDLDEVEAGGRLGLMLALEGTESLGSSPELAEAFWALGVRMVGLTWARRNAFADGSGEPNPGGLSRLGQELVDRLVALGCAIDLAHASERTFADVLERAPGAAVLVSHTCCRALRDTPRNVSDDQLRAIAESGGVVGIMALPLALGSERADLDLYLDHVEHAISVAGAAHVCVGGDFMAQLTRSGTVTITPRELATLPAGVDPGTPVAGLEGPQDYPALAEGLARRGHDEATVTAVLHGNLVHFLRRTLPPC